MTRLVGVDISKYSGYPDWKKVKQSGVQFVILRLGSGYDGGYVDKTFEYNYRECKKAGVGVGVYAVSYLNISTETDMTLKTLKDKQLEYPVCFDIEDFSLSGRNYTNTQLANHAVRYCSEIERAGYYVGIYSNKTFFESRLYWERIKKYDIWIAHWNKNVNYNGKHAMHQYTNQGQWCGIASTGEGGVDTNWCFADYPSLMRKLGTNGHKKQKIEVKGLSKMDEEKLLNQTKQTVVTYEVKDYELTVKIAKQHKVILVPAELNMDFGKMKKLKDTIIGIGSSTGKISGRNHGITGYYDYLVSADKVGEFSKDRTKFSRRK